MEADGRMRLGLGRRRMSAMRRLQQRLLLGPVSASSRWWRRRRQVAISRRDGASPAVAAFLARTATAVRYRPVTFDRVYAVTLDVLTAVVVLDARRYRRRLHKHTQRP